MKPKWTRKGTKCPNEFWYTYGRELDLPFWIAVRKTRCGHKWKFSFMTGYCNPRCIFIPSEQETEFHSLKECKQKGKEFYDSFIMRVVEPLEGYRDWTEEHGKKFGRKNVIPGLIKSVKKEKNLPLGIEPD